MKLEFIEDFQDCQINAIADEGFIDLSTWLFDENIRTEVPRLFKYHVKWLGTIKQNKKDITTIHLK